MLNFSAIKKGGLIGKVLRFPLQLVPCGTEVCILQGRMKGKKWIAGSGDNHGYWLGSYELDMQKAFCRTIPPGAVVYDVGANAGFFTLLASELAGPSGRVIAFEPFPANFSYLQRHIDMNHCTNVVLVETAVSAKSGFALLGRENSDAEWQLSEKGTLRVRALALDDYSRGEKGNPPTHIKIDVEGGELGVLIGAKGILADARPVIYLETHGRHLHWQCCDYLKQAGYDILPLNEKKGVEGSHAIMARPQD